MCLSVYGYTFVFGSVTGFTHELWWGFFVIFLHLLDLSQNTSVKCIQTKTNEFVCVSRAKVYQKVLI